MQSLRLFLFLLLFPVLSFAQINKVQLQAAGLTCSMCSNSINKSLRSLSYVSKVETDLETNTFTVSFTNAAAANFDELKNKVENAGFSVISMQVEINLDGLQVANDTHTRVAGKQFHFVKVKDQQLNGTRLFTIVDKGFLPARQYKIYAAATHMDCMKTGMMAACCKGDHGGRIYHITI